MGGLGILARARQAGLDVQAKGDVLAISGPKQHAELARALLAAKAEVLAELECEARIAAAVWGAVPICAEDFRIRTVEDLLALGGPGDPPWCCMACSTARWWRLTGKPSKARPWICGTCHAPSVPVDRVEWFDGGRR